MTAQRRIGLWSLIAGHAAGGPVTLEHVCTAMVSTCRVDGAAVAVSLPAAPRETVFASDQVASDMEELSLTLGEGPCVDAVASGPVLVPDVMAPHCLARWPVFVPAAGRAGVRAVFALPLHVGGIHTGVVDLYRGQPGEMNREQLTDALVLADIAFALLLDAPAGDRRHDGHWPESTGPQHPEVHQATGMVSVQLGVTAAVALTRLRAYAYAHDRRLHEVAGDVVARRLRFNPDRADEDRGGC
ncbi:MAG TPA: GAF and ANTAR domain-containing protein [Rugosimonospora sp.]|nr:GAF and ANTAR domain-containing protein [Rugosimonospora sp.]